MARKRSLGLWYRFYVCALDDPKVEGLSDAVYRVWTKVNAIATIYGGIVPSDMKILTIKLRKPPVLIRKYLQVLVDAKLLDHCGDNYSPHDWEEWQFNSDVSTSRVKAFRERQRNVSETANETELKRSKTVSETTMERPHRQSTEIEKVSISPETGSTHTRKHASPKALNGHSGMFESFYEDFQNKKSRGAAEKAYMSALKRGATVEQLLAGAQRYAASRKGEDQKFTKHPAAWLNQDCWLDEIGPASPQIDPTIAKMREIERLERETDPA